MDAVEHSTIAHGELSPAQIVHTVNLKLAALGCAPVDSYSEEDFQELARTILHHGGEGEPPQTLPPVDVRIQNYLDRTCGEGAACLPIRTLALDRAGLARAVSLPVDGEEFQSGILNSY